MLDVKDPDFQHRLALANTNTHADSSLTLTQMSFEWRGRKYKKGNPYSIWWDTTINGMADVLWDETPVAQEMRRKKTTQSKSFIPFKHYNDLAAFSQAKAPTGKTQYSMSMPQTQSYADISVLAGISALFTGVSPCMCTYLTFLASCYQLVSTSTTPSPAAKLTSTPRICE